MFHKIWKPELCVCMHVCVCVCVVQAHYSFALFMRHILGRAHSLRFQIFNCAETFACNACFGDWTIIAYKHILYIFNEHRPASANRILRTTKGLFCRYGSRRVLPSFSVMFCRRFPLGSWLQAVVFSDLSEVCPCVSHPLCSQRDLSISPHGVTLARSVALDHYRESKTDQRKENKTGQDGRDYRRSGRERTDWRGGKKISLNWICQIMETVVLRALPQDRSW